MRFGKFLRLTFVGSLIPGVGLIAAGRRRFGGFILTLLLMLLIGSGVVIARTDAGKLASYSGDREALLYAAAGLGSLAIVWIFVALISHRSLEPQGLHGGKRLIGALTVIVAASLVVTPLAMAARNALTQRDVIESISGGTTAKGEPESQTVPELTNEADPWEDFPRVNVLVLGADIGKGRTDENGIRPDTQIVASIDTQTGDMQLISLPRNLSRMPFPANSTLAEKYPDGFIDYDTMDSTKANSFLNAVYNNVPALYPELELSGADANKLAVSGALGIEIHYYVMINLDGFEAIIDALGTITIDVGERVPIDYGQRPEDPNCVNLARDWIEPGRQEMDGVTALKYSRSRCVSDNYRRMERQECVIRAVIDRAEPMTVATRYQSLASATKDMVRTDIPSDLFPAFIELLVDVKGSKIRSMSLDHDLFAKIGGSPQNPDYEALHERVQEKLAPSKPRGSGTEPGRVKSSDDESPC